MAGDTGPTFQLEHSPGRALVLLAVGGRQFVQGREAGPVLSVPRRQHLNTRRHTVRTQLATTAAQNGYHQACYRVMLFNLKSLLVNPPNDALRSKDIERPGLKIKCNNAIQ